MKKETARQEMIRLLRNCAVADDSREPQTRAAVLYGDFIRSGYLHGDVAHDEDGIPNKCLIDNITVSGRLLLQDLEAAEKAASISGIAKKIGMFAGGWIFGIATQAIVAFLKHFMP